MHRYPTNVNTKRIAERIIAEQITTEKECVPFYTSLWRHWLRTWWSVVLWQSLPEEDMYYTLPFLNYAVGCTTLTERIPLTGRIPTLIFSSRDAPAEKDTVAIDVDAIGRETTVALGVSAKCL